MNPLTNYPANTIHLPIKRKWFDMILSGEKREEYREIKPYWTKRLTNAGRWSIPDRYVSKSHKYSAHGTNPPIRAGKTTLTLTAGYGSDKPRLVVELKKIEVKYPNPDWCPPETEGVWFALVLGKVLDTHNLPIID